MFNLVFNLGGTWVETASLKIIGKLDEDVETRIGSNKFKIVDFMKTFKILLLPRL